MILRSREGPELLCLKHRALLFNTMWTLNVWLTLSPHAIPDNIPQKHWNLIWFCLFSMISQSNDLIISKYPFVNVRDNSAERSQSKCWNFLQHQRAPSWPKAQGAASSPAALQVLGPAKVALLTISPNSLWTFLSFLPLDCLISSLPWVVTQFTLPSAISCQSESNPRVCFLMAWPWS